jgi:hypothetical protein
MFKRYNSLLEAKFREVASPFNPSQFHQFDGLSHIVENERVRP